MYIAEKQNESDTESEDGDEVEKAFVTRRIYTRSVFRPAYSIDSCDQLIEANYSTQVKTLPPEFIV